MQTRRFRNCASEHVRTIEVAGGSGGFKDQIKSNWLIFGGLAVLGFVYYSSYYKYFFNWADEGSVALIAERLLNGERPFLDVETGYGILWFLPISLLYKVFGTGFIVVRVWFIALGFLTTLAAYFVILRLTRRRALATIVSLLVLFFAGSGYKTYIPLLVIAGAAVLFLYDARTSRSVVHPGLAAVITGAYFGVAFLIRGDIATVYLVLFISYQVIITTRLAVIQNDYAEFLILGIRIGGVLAAALIITTPFLMHAAVNGYLDGFLSHYTVFARQLLEKMQMRGRLDFGATADGGVALLARPPFKAVFLPTTAAWTFLTYTPLAVLALIWLLVITELLKRPIDVDSIASFVADRAYLAFLSIAAFAAFPQFFVFRPDMAHLSEFFPGFIVLCAYLLFVLSSQSYRAKATRKLHWFILATVTTICAGYLIVFAVRYNEGIGLRKGRDHHLRVQDRLDIYLTEWEYRYLSEISSIILETTKPTDYVLCFPYCPGVNFMTGRRTFQRTLYADDSFPSSRPTWMSETITEIVTKKPRAVIVWNWAVNNTENSRFSVWAEPVYRHLQHNYELKTRIARNERDRSWIEVYALKQVDPPDSERRE